MLAPVGTHAGVDVDGGRLDANDVARALEAHRRELTGYCYRMLGSTFEAEDAVQETMLRAWRGSERFEGRSPLRAWLYRIATNVCFDALRDSQRRARPMDLGPDGSADAPLGPPGARVRVDPAGARRPGAAGRRRPGRAGDAPRVGPAGVRRRPPAPATAAERRADPSGGPALAGQRGRGAARHQRRLGEQRAPAGPGDPRRRGRGRGRRDTGR